MSHMSYTTYFLNVVSQLIKKLRTKDDLDMLKGELDILENALYQSADKYNEVLKNDIRNWVSESIFQDCKSGNEDVSDYIKNIRQELQNVSVLSASFYFEPSIAFIETVSVWLKKNVSENIVIDLLLNNASLGGIQLSYRGKYLDLSLRKKILAELERISLK